MNTLRVFIGVDPRQWLAFTVAAHSIVSRSSIPVSVTPLVYSQLPIKRKGLTEFTFTRYLVPWLCNYEGHALFLDADTLCLADIAELPWEHSAGVAVVRHDVSALNGKNIAFERASVMLFDNARCKALTPEYIETGKPQSFEWASNYYPLDPAWNHLVGYDTPGPAKIVHFTQGIPCFAETEKDEYAQEWRDELQKALGTVSWQEIMGPSVHAQFKRDPLQNFWSPFSKTG